MTVEESVKLYESLLEESKRVRSRIDYLTKIDGTSCMDLLRRDCELFFHEMCNHVSDAKYVVPYAFSIHLRSYLLHKFNIKGRKSITTDEYWEIKRSIESSLLDDEWLTELNKLIKRSKKVK